MSATWKMEGGQSMKVAVSGLTAIHGYSAYELAVFNGYEGTETEWLASLRGEPGLTTYVAMFEEREVTFKELAGALDYAYVSPVNLVIGESYVVKYDGVEYVCECYDASEVRGTPEFKHCLGYMGDYDIPACMACKGFPFGLYSTEDLTCIYNNRNNGTSVTPHTVGIYRFVRVPDDLLPEVDESYNGKILSVVKGKWTPTDDFTNEVIAQMLQDIADLKYVPIDITQITDNVVTMEMGSVVNEVTVSWTLNKEPASQTLDGVAVDLSARSKVITGPFSTNKTFTLAVTDERGATDSASTAISFLNGVYYGVLESGATVDSAAILALTKKLQGSKGITFTANAGATQRIIYALPTRYGTPNFNVGGFDGGFALAKTFDLTNASGYTESYAVWLSENVGLGSTTVKVT